MRFFDGQLKLVLGVGQDVVKWGKMAIVEL
jgi:hypothetical protein